MLGCVRGKASVRVSWSGLVLGVRFELRVRVTGLRLVLVYGLGVEG